MSLSTFLIIFVIAFIAMVPISLVVEALRPKPSEPSKLYWAEDIPIQYADLDGTRVRYIKTGEGPNLLLLHTLRTQLDIFQKIIPELSKSFTVYAMDYPGHGWSDIPETDYTPELFLKTVEQFLDVLNIEGATLAGVSIGGSISLLLAARQNERIKNVISINPYDYGKGKGVERGNIVAWLIFTLARIPVLGETVMRFRNKMVENMIMQGGVANNDALPEEYLKQIWDAGVRKGHYRGFINFIRNAHKWEEARREYGQIKVPIHLIYGEKDWSREDERKRNIDDIPGATFEIVKKGGHFLVLDQPDEVIRLIKQYVHI